MGALIRLSFFLRCFVYFCLQKGTVAFLRSVGYISKTCFGKPTITVTEISNSVSNSPESSSEELYKLSMNEFILSSNIDTQKKYKSDASHRDRRTRMLESVANMPVETDGLNQTNDQRIETSERLKTQKEAITTEVESFLESLSDQKEPNSTPTAASESELQNNEFKPILKKVNNQQNEKEIIKNYALFALPDADELSNDNTLCPQCNTPCDVEDINDYGKCTLCKQRELRDPNVHRVRNSDERLTFFSNPVDKKFLPREKTVAKPSFDKEQNLLYEKQRKEQEERLTYSPKSPTLPAKLSNNNVSTPPIPISVKENGRYSTSSPIQESLHSTSDIIPDKKMLKKSPQGVNIIQNNPTSLKQDNIKSTEHESQDEMNLLSSENNIINVRSEEPTDSENFINLREILDTEVFGRIDDNYANIVNLMRVSTHMNMFADTISIFLMYLNCSYSYCFCFILLL